MTLSCVPEAPRAPSGSVLRDVGSRFLATAAAAAAAAFAAAASASFRVTALRFRTLVSVVPLLAAVVALDVLQRLRSLVAFTSSAPVATGSVAASAEASTLGERALQLLERSLGPVVAVRAFFAMALPAVSRISVIA